MTTRGAFGVCALRGWNGSHLRELDPDPLRFPKVAPIRGGGLARRLHAPRVQHAPRGRRVLAVEPTATVAGFLADHLRRAGYLVDVSARAGDALRAVLLDPPDLAIVAAAMPDSDGLFFCRQVRSFFSLPLILVVDQAREEDGLAALDHGVDDYLTRPLSAHAVTARVGAVLRRAEHRLVSQEPKWLRTGEIEIDVAARQVLVRGRPVHLSPKEHALLVYLMLHPRQAMKTEELRRAVWGSHAGSARTVTVHVHWLRRKIEEDPARPRYLQTVRGVGYRFEP